MNIEITKNYNEADLVTHSGTFHADEVFASVVLNYALKRNLKLIRVSEVKEREDKIVYDIGEKEYDHHQLGGNGAREDGTKYASFGLIWKAFGRKALENLKVEKDYIDEELKEIDKKLVEGIDAIDNGALTIKTNPKVEVKTISDLIGLFNKKWDEEKGQDECFMEALNFANIIFLNTVKSIESKLKSRKYIEDAIEHSTNNILILDKFMPWKEHLLNSKNLKAKDILYVIYKSERGGYNAYAVPKKLGSFENRKPFPRSWSGLRGEELAKITGVKTATFCHNECFICGAKEKDDIIKLTKIAVGGKDYE